jgi:hypothetical protein
VIRRGTGATPGGQGRYDGFDVLAEQRTWDPITAGVVLRRLGPPEPLRFFSPYEEPIAATLFDHLLDEWDEPRIPVLNMVDERLNGNRTDGWRYDDLPEDQEAWHATLAFLDEDARASHGRRLAELSREEQAELIEAVRTAPGGRWHDLPAEHVWSLWTRYACTAFYSHPWAWNEIGFGGPAYPRGYKNIGLDRRESWERQEHDAQDPIPWVQRAESARTSAARTGKPPR